MSKISGAKLTLQFCGLLTKCEKWHDANKDNANPVVREVAADLAEKIVNLNKFMKGRPKDKGFTQSVKNEINNFIAFATPIISN